MWVLAALIPPTDLADPPASEHNMLPGFLLAGGILLLIVIMLRKLRVRARNRGDQPTPREQIEQLQADAAEREKTARLETSMAEAEQLVRRLAAMLDNKAARLELLLAEADAKLAAAERASPVAGRTTTSSSTSPPRPKTPRSFREQVDDLASRGMSAEAISSALGRSVAEVELALALRSDVNRPDAPRRPGTESRT